MSDPGLAQQSTFGTTRTASSSDRSGELQLERIACPLCRSSVTEIVVHSRDHLCGIPGEFTIERCRQCRHLFLNPRPIRECLVDCYPEQYGPHQTAPDIAGASATTSAEIGRPWYLRYLPLKQVPGLRTLYFWLMDDRSQPVPTPEEVDSALDSETAAGGHSQTEMEQTVPQALELGCATGRYLQRLQQRHWKVTGIEPGERPARLAQNAGLNVICGTLDSCALPEARFHVAAAWMVIEHVPDPRDTLMRLHRLLKPGGLLLISIPNAGCWESTIFGRHWYAWEPPRHLHHFTPATAHQLLSECGFSSIQITHQRTLLYVVGSLGIAILSRWPQSRIGRTLKNYPDHPAVFWQLLLAPMAHLLALLRQGGRLTISARRPALPSQICKVAEAATSGSIAVPQTQVFRNGDCH